jgi:hypothetical protein
MSYSAFMMRILTRLPIPDEAISKVEAVWDPYTKADNARINHYCRCIFAGLLRGVTKQRSLNRSQKLQQKANEDSSEFLEQFTRLARK